MENSALEEDLRSLVNSRNSLIEVLRQRKNLEDKENRKSNFEEPDSNNDDESSERNLEESECNNDDDVFTFDKALLAAEQNVELEPDNVSFLCELARALADRAEISGKGKNYKECLCLYDRVEHLWANSILDRGDGKKDDDPQYMLHVERFTRVMDGAYKYAIEANDMDRALFFVSRSLQVGGATMSRKSIDSHIANLNQLAGLHEKCGRHREAIKVYTTSLDHVEPLFDEYPWHFFIGCHYGGAHIGLANVHQALGNKSAELAHRSKWFQYRAGMDGENFEEWLCDAKKKSGNAEEEVLLERLREKWHNLPSWKKLTVPCWFPKAGVYSPYPIFLLPAVPGRDAIEDQARTLREDSDGIIPADVRERLQKLHTLAIENKVKFPELCVFAFEDETAATAIPLVPAPTSRKDNQKANNVNETVLHKLIIDKKWECFRERLVSNPLEVAQPFHDGSPILSALIIDEAPLDIIRSALDIFPDACKEACGGGYLPLHVAGKFGTSHAAATFLLNTNPIAVTQTNDCGETPAWLAKNCTWENHKEEKELVVTLMEQAYFLRQSTLLQLVFYQKWNKVRHRLESHPEEIQLTCSTDQLPLHYVILFGAPTDIVLSIIETYPGGVTKTCCFDNVPLHLACSHGASVSTVHRLITIHPNGVSQRNKMNVTPFSNVCCSKWKYHEEEKNEIKGIIEKEFFKHTSKLLELIHHQKWDEVRGRLKSHPLEAMDASPDKKIPLHWVFMSEAPIDITLSLIENCSAEYQAQNGALPLHYACSWGAPCEAFIALLVANPKGLAVQSAGWTPLDYAQSSEWKFHQQEQQKVIAALELGVEYWQNRNVLHFEAYSGERLHKLCSTDENWEKVRDFFNGASKDAARKAIKFDFLGKTPLHHACRYNVPADVLKMFIHLCPQSIVVEDTFGKTPIHWALKYDASVDVVRILFDSEDGRSLHSDCSKWGKPNQIDQLRRGTPLRYAIQEGRPLVSVIRFLLGIEGETALFVHNEIGQTPLDSARYESVPDDVVQFLANTEWRVRKSWENEAPSAEAVKKKIEREMTVWANDKGRYADDAAKKQQRRLVEAIAIAGLSAKAFDNLRSSSGGGFKIPKTEERGITIKQLHLVWIQILLRCEAEGWTDHSGNLLEPKTVTLYDVEKYIILPATVGRRCSFVELVARGRQLPRFFVSHWWGEPVWDFLACLEEHKRNNDDKGVDEDTPYWICAYANNQWALDSAVTTNPSDSSFRKAMDIVEGTISFLDKDCICFSRIWCCYEIYISLVDILETREDYSWCAYVAKKWENQSGSECIAIGLEPGDCKNFSFELAQKSLNFKVEHGTASVEQDRIHILNTIAGRTDLDACPPQSDPKFDRVNAVLHGRFAAGLITEAAKIGELKPFAAALSTGQMRTLSLDFENSEIYTEDTVLQIFAFLPNTLRKLTLVSIGSNGVTLLAKQLMVDPSKTLLQLHTLNIITSDASDEAIADFANAASAGALPNLKVLNFKMTKIQCAGLEALAAAFSDGALPDLEILELFSFTLRANEAALPGKLVLADAFKGKRITFCNALRGCSLGCGLCRGIEKEERLPAWSEGELRSRGLSCGYAEEG